MDSIWVCDHETLADYFLSVFLNYKTGEVRTFEIYDRKNELKEFKKFVNEVEYMITFNGVHFDDIVTNFIMQQDEWDGWLLAQKIYQCAQNVIDSQNNPDAYDKIKKYKYGHKFKQIDIFLYWSKMLRLSQKLSLKSFQANMGLSIVEMPIDHWRTNLTDDEIEMVKSYCLHDVQSTCELVKRKKQEVNLRYDIAEDFNLPQAISQDAPKIASEILLDSYCKLTWDGRQYFEDYKKQIKKTEYIKPTIYLKDVLVPIQFKTPQFIQLYKNYQNAVNTYSEEVIYKNFDGHRIKLQFAIGGLHTENDNESYHSDEKNLVITSDIGGMYPRLIYNYKLVPKSLGSEFLETYKEIYDSRIIAKRNKDKVKDALYKLVLNSFSGLLDNKYFWGYSPESALKLRITGQLILARLVEECYLHKFRVVSVNTDGQEVIVPRDRIQEYFTICQQIEKEFDVEFEHKEYESIYYESVNDYFAKMVAEYKPGTLERIPYESIKEKGFYVTERIIDKSNEFQVIPKAVQAYFLKGVQPEKFLENHKELLDYTSQKKIDRSYTVTHNGEKVQQLNRFYPSSDAKNGYLYKEKVNQKTQKYTKAHIFSDSGVSIVNELPEKFPEDINYNWFLEQIRKHISYFESNQLTLF